MAAAMKTVCGWIRGHLCGKKFRDSGHYVCALCNRRGDTPIDLCFPVSIRSLDAKTP